LAKKLDKKVKEEYKQSSFDKEKYEKLDSINKKIHTQEDSGFVKFFQNIFMCGCADNNDNEKLDIKDNQDRLTTENLGVTTPRSKEVN